MAEFLRRPLRRLDQLFDFVGSQVQTRFLDLSGITLVQDTSQLTAEARSRDLSEDVRTALGIGANPDGVGLFGIPDNVNSVGAADTRLEFDPWAFVDANLGREASEVDLWLMGWAGGAVTGAYDATEPGSLVIERRTAARTATRFDIECVQRIVGMNGVAAKGNGLNSFVTEGEIRPRPLFRNDDEEDEVAVLFRSTGNDTWYATTYYLLAPKGITPYWRL